MTDTMSPTVPYSTAVANLNGDQAAIASLTSAYKSQGLPTEPSVVSTQNGQKVLQTKVDEHNQDMTNLQNGQNQQTTDKTTPVTADASTIAGIKAVGGLTAEEAKIGGVDLTQGYTYDSKSGLFVPQTSTTGSEQQVNNNYENDRNKINDAFSNITGQMDAATQALIQSIQGIYNDRIVAQQDVNRRELQSFNTMNIRGGTERYAGGVAQSILTADENAGLDRIKAIASEMAGKIAEANQNLTDKKYTAFVENRNEVDKLTTERNATLQNLKDKATAAAKDQRDFLYNKQKDEQAQKLAVDKFALDKSNAAVDNAYKKAEMAKIYNDMNTGDITSANSWVTAIKNGSAKLSDVPKNLKNAVAAGLANGPSNQSDILNTTKQSLDELNQMVTDNQGFTSAVGAKGLTGGLLFGWTVPGSQAANFESKLTQVKNDIVLPNLTLLHGLGRVTDREFQALTSAVTSLNTNLSESEFKTELKNVTDRINEKMNQAQADAQSESIQKARTSGYSDDEIISEYSKDPTMAAKIKQAQSAGYSASDIVNFLAKPQ